MIGKSGNLLLSEVLRLVEESFIGLLAFLVEIDIMLNEKFPKLANTDLRL